MFKSATLMLIATVGTFLLLGALLFIPLPDKNAQVFLALATFILGYFFGSSASGQRETEFKAMDTPPPPDTPTGSPGFVRLSILPLLALAALLCFTAVGCAPTVKQIPATTTAQVSVTGEAADTLAAIGSVLESTPRIMETLYQSGKLTKGDYNKVVPIYNTALSSYQVAVSVLNAAVAAGKDPSKDTAYLAALQRLLADKATVDNILASAGGAS